MKPTFSGAPWASAGIGNGEASPSAAVPAAPFRIVRRVGRTRRWSPLMALSSLEYGRSGAAPEAVRAFAQASPRTPLKSSGFLRRAGGDADAAEHRAGFFPGASEVGRSSVDLAERR